VIQPSEPGSSTSLTVLVNGEPRRVPTGSSLADLVAALGLAERRFAAAINREVVPRGAQSKRVLAIDDRIEILEAVGGG